MPTTDVRVSVAAIDSAQRQHRLAAGTLACSTDGAVRTLLEVRRAYWLTWLKP